ncbi:MAG: hypothetical protein LBJ31_00445 [Treponema sp.]|jgi:hypothetical protein|nr:hypothetical protein [Treponema sp.]
MKRISAVLVFGLLAVSFCFAQVQVGNASYNASKEGFTISHSSLSFNTHVKVTNLRNNRFVEALVDYRIPISTERIADISREAGDALDISKNGMTLVQIEVLPPRTAESAPAAVQQPAPQSAAPSSTITQVLPLQTITDLQYVPVPAAAAAVPCCSAFLILVILLLLILVIAIQVVILVLLRRRLPLWPWCYPLWIRRRQRYLKKTKRHLR